MSLAFPSVPSDGSLSPFLNSIVRLGIMARPERFELPTYGFVVCTPIVGREGNQQVTCAVVGADWGCWAE